MILPSWNKSPYQNRYYDCCKQWRKSKGTYSVYKKVNGYREKKDTKVFAWKIVSVHRNKLWYVWCALYSIYQSLYET